MKQEKKLLNSRGKPYQTPNEVYARRIRQLTTHTASRKYVGRFKFGSRVKLTGGIYRAIFTDSGKKRAVWIATLYVMGRRQRRVFSVNRCGEYGAKLAASLQRLVWLIDFGLWKPRDGDPLEILSYSEAHKGNRDYENSVNEERSSPFIRQRDDE